MKRIMASVLILISVSVSSAYADNPYYGFYESAKGASYKLFRHNVFNFEVDMPAQWTFGVIGKAPTAVAALYPAQMNTAEFKPSYEMISVGIMPLRGISLDKACELTIGGMKAAHQGLKILQNKKMLVLNGNPAVNTVFQWPSKTGNMIIEDVYFISAYRKIYSMNIRTVMPISKQAAKVHQDIINSFTPIKEVVFK